MLLDTTKILSADDHVIEPPHLWVDRVPARYRDRCPRMVKIAGRQAWEYEGEITYIPMGSCRALPGFREDGYPPAWILTECGASSASPTTPGSPGTGSS
jgi:hypothetical protein